MKLEIAHIQENMGVTESWLVRYNSGQTNGTKTSVYHKRLRNGDYTIHRSNCSEWDEHIPVACKYHTRFL